MENPVTSLEILARGISVACLLLLVVRALLAYRDLAAGKWFALLAIGLTVYVLIPVLPTHPGIRYPAVLLATSIAPVFWLFCDHLFNDQPTIPRSPVARATAVIGFLLLAISSFHRGEVAPGQPLSLALFYCAYAARLSFLVLAVRAVLNSWHDDLVAARRSLRGLFAVLSAAYILVVLVVELILVETPVPSQLQAGHAVLLAIVFGALALWFLITDPEYLFRNAATSSPVTRSSATDVPGLSYSEEQWIAALKAKMEVERAYRRSDLGIGDLADELSIPEHLLRQLINRRLGYRNFRHYLNNYRLDDIAARLRDPSQQRLPVLTLALDAGFASITPFNRAFRAAFGVTPTQYRKNPPQTGLHPQKSSNIG